MIRRIAVRGIALHEGKLFAVRLKAYKEHLKRDNGYWCIPGGKLEEGESLHDCIAREMFEETGVQPVVGNLLYVQQFVHDNKDTIEFFFHITNGADYLSVDLAHTSHGLEEIEEFGFIDPSQVSRILPEFLATEDLVAQAAAGTTKIFSRL